ncbi:hypothetical protein MTO96_047686 [Rhipicephalus appendiculatus]
MLVFGIFKIKLIKPRSSRVSSLRTLRNSLTDRKMSQDISTLDWVNLAGTNHRLYRNAGNRASGWHRETERTHEGGSKRRKDRNRRPLIDI